MRRTKIFGVAALLAALALVATAPATAGVAMRASMEGYISGLIAEPELVEARCGPGWFIVLLNEGEGELTSEAYPDGLAFDYESEHCTRLVTENPVAGVTVGKVGFGEMTFFTADGDLYLDYRGTFVMKGTFPTDYRSDFSGSFTITGGNGHFEGASGHGHMAVVDQPSGATNELVGSLKVG